ncbi:hypothetical protein [Actinoplanes sp. NPDC026623]|uniref:hypothetical protein n=1 Tax=Actinoplanes sp. NPDC026623 TaxID=3155610 RepID=UPI0033D76EAC
MTAVTPHDTTTPAGPVFDAAPVLEDDAVAVVCDLDAYERPTDRPAPFWFTYKGRNWLLMDQIDTDWQELDAAQGNPRLMMHTLLPPEQRATLLAHRMEIYRLEKLMSDYRAHYNLAPDGVPAP